MPQAILPILTWIGITGAAAAVAANVIATVLITVALTKIESLFIGKPSAGPPPPLNVTGRGTTEFRRIVLGTAKCGGAIVFQQCAGSNNQYLFTVVAYAGHDRAAIDSAYLESQT